MKCELLLVIAIIQLIGVQVYAFRIINLDVPTQVKTGSTAQLKCEYELAPYSKLYTLRWLKNNVEFYRYEPDGQTRHRFYRIHGLQVNVSIYLSLWQPDIFTDIFTDSKIKQHSYDPRKGQQRRHGRTIHL